MLLFGCALVRLRGGWMGSIMSPWGWGLSSQALPLKCKVQYTVLSARVMCQGYQYEGNRWGNWDINSFEIGLLWQSLMGCCFCLSGLYTAVPHMSEEQRHERPMTAPIFLKENLIIQHKPTELVQVHVTDVFCLRGKHWSCALCKLGTYLSKTTLWGGHM